MTSTNTGNDPSTNGSGASRTSDAADIFTDLAALRLTPDEAGQIGAEEVLAHVSVRKPSDRPGASRPRDVADDVDICRP